MFTRTTGLLIVPCWLAAMGWLTVHDAWPRWVAPAPPAVRGDHLQRITNQQAQYTIRDEFGPLGSVWSAYIVDVNSIRRTDLVWVDRLPHLPLDVVPLRISVNSAFTAEGVLDEFEVRVENPDTVVPVKLHGERFHADFSFSLENGTVMRTFKIPLADGGLISGMFDPFAEYRDLQVGNSWRMQVFNPIAVLTGIGNRFISLLVQVTKEERINTGNWEGNCLVVEAGGAKTWVGASGEVRLQEVMLPMVGKVRIVREPHFDSELRTAIRRINLGATRREADR